MNAPGSPPLQLLLPLYVRAEQHFAHFVEENGGRIAGTVRDFLQSVPGDTSLFLHGPPGCGKTHLLVAALAEVRHAQVAYLPLAVLATMEPEACLEGLERQRLVCLDDLQSVVGNAPWEAALFHFYNRCQASGCRLLIAADRPPGALGVQLPDLASRLAWGVVLALPPLSESGRRQVLTERATLRGIALSEEVLQYLLLRSQRDLPSLIAVLDRLDKASLTEKRHITIPFIKKTMQW